MTHLSTIYLLAACATLAASSAAGAANLFPGGDFTAARKDLSGAASANGGRVALFQEEYTWNKCGYVEITAPTTNKDGFVTWNAVAMAGSSDGKTLGMAVEGGKTYDFKLELRGDRDIRAGVSLVAWKDGVWKDSARAKTTLGSVKVPKTWTAFSGSFKVPEGKTRACLQIQMWSSTRHPPAKLKTGDRVYFDNIVVTEAEDGFAALAKRGSEKAQQVPRVKAVASGETFDDFFEFRREKGCVGPAADAPRVRVEAGHDAFLVDVTVNDAKGISPGGESVWSGDAIELFFGPTCDNIDRSFTQIAWNPSGGRFSKPASAAGWEIVSNKTSGNEWKSRVRVPYSSLGFGRVPKKGESLAFNVAWSRKLAKQMGSWGNVASGFSDVKAFGRIIIGSYSDALACDWGVKEQCDGREAYEKRVSELATARRQAEVDRLSDSGFTVAVVPVDSDYAVPFVPRESFHPVQKIDLSAAVNERVGLPVAILNLTDKAEEYIVRLETSTFDPSPDKVWADKQMNGTWGLKGFPEAQVVARHALRIKDTDSEPVTLRLEPLPKMDEACSMQVPSKEAGLAWFDFDTAGVAPGVYEGRIRVIPLGSAAKWEPYKGVSYHNRMYSGKMQDIPVRLEVLPIELSKEPAQPFGFFEGAGTEGQFQLMHEIGTRDFQISPWSFRWKLDAAGNIDPSKPNEVLLKEERQTRRIFEWSKARGIHPTFFVGFSTYRVFQGNYGASKDPAKCRRLWPQYLRNLKACMNAWGVPDSDYAIEVWDEPDPKLFDEIKESLTVAKAVVPEVRLLITLGAHVMSAEDMRRLDPYIDGWTLWSYGYFSRKEHLEYIADALARGKCVCHYTCPTSGRTPIYEYRLHAWFAWRRNLSGNQFFHFQKIFGAFGTSDFKTAASSGLAYRSFESTMPSLRYMSMRRGVEDVKYLAKLKAVAGDVPEVKAFLKDAPERVLDVERHDKTAPDRMRAEAARLILKYQKQGAAK